MEISTNPNPIIRFFFTPIIVIAKFIGRNWPELLMKIRYFARFSKRLNLDNPQTLNEKILYMSLRTDTSLWTRLADKYNVREYVEEHGLSDILVPLLGYWHKAEDIDFDKLPEQFVIKSTHGCGDIIIVNDKSKININDVRKRMHAAISETYGELEGGKHYMRIKPAILAEKLLIHDEDSAKYSSSIIDYKVWCFNGKPCYIMTCTNREHNSVELQLYDTNWIPQTTYIKPSTHYKLGASIPAPNNLDKMLKHAEILSKLFPVVRVDFYNLGGNICFGEMTFTSLGGMMDYYTDEFQKMCGDLIDVNYKG